MLKFVLFAISLIILAILIVYSNPEKLLLNLEKFDLQTGILFLAIATFTAVLRVYRFQFLLKNKMNFRELFPIHIYSLALSNIIPGRVSEPFRAALLKAVKGIPFSFSLAAVFLERLSDMIILLLFSLFAFYFTNASLFIIPFIIVLFAIIIIATTSQHSLTLRGINIILRSIGFQKYVNVFRKLLKEAKISKRFVIPIIFSIFIWGIDAIVFYKSLELFGVDVNYFVVLSFFALSLIVGLVSFLPGGIGSAEASMSILLSMIGVDYSIALTAVLIARLFTLWYIIIIGMLFSLTIKQEKKKKV